MSAIKHDEETRQLRARALQGDAAALNSLLVAAYERGEQKTVVPVAMRNYTELMRARRTEAEGPRVLRESGVVRWTAWAVLRDSHGFSLCDVVLLPEGEYPDTDRRWARVPWLDSDAAERLQEVPR